MILACIIVLLGSIAFMDWEYDLYNMHNEAATHTFQPPGPGRGGGSIGFLAGKEGMHETMLTTVKGMNNFSAILEIS